MAALTQERSTIRRGDGVVLDLLTIALKDNVKIWQGAIVLIDPTTGLVEPGTGTNPGKIAVGKAETTVDNTFVGHASAAVSVSIRQGCHYYGSGTAGDAITAANIGAPCYVIDDQLVGLTDGSGTRALAGVICDFDSVRGVLVEMSLDLLPSKVRFIDHSSVPAAQVAGEVIVFRKAWAAPGAGAQDVVLFAAGAVPVKGRILDVIVKTSNAGAGTGTLTLRTAVAGGGGAESSAITTGAIGTARDALGTSSVTLTTDAMVARLTDGTSSGEVIVLFRPEQ